jgi:preprotein translocase subunit SecE
MAMIGRKQPAAPSPGSPSKTRAAAGGGRGGGSEATTTRTGRLSSSIRNVIAELRKVTWPTREETRNLTVVVVGISAVIGISLGLLDFLLASLYNLFK